MLQLVFGVLIGGSIFHAISWELQKLSVHPLYFRSLVHAIGALILSAYQLGQTTASLTPVLVWSLSYFLIDSLTSDWIFVLHHAVSCYGLLLSATLDTNISRGIFLVLYFLGEVTNPTQILLELCILNKVNWKTYRFLSFFQCIFFTLVRSLLVPMFLFLSSDKLHPHLVWCTVAILVVSQWWCFKLWRGFCRKSCGQKTKAD